MCQSQAPGALTQINVQHCPADGLRLSAFGPERRGFAQARALAAIVVRGDRAQKPRLQGVRVRGLSKHQQGPEVVHIGVCGAGDDQVVQGGKKTIGVVALQVLVHLQALGLGAGQGVRA